MEFNIIARYLKSRRRQSYRQRLEPRVQYQQQGQLQNKEEFNSTAVESYYDINKTPEISDYIQKRFLPVFHSYKTKTKINARRFQLWRSSIIILALFIVIFDVAALGYYAGSRFFSSAATIASSIAAALILGSTAFVQLTKSQENLLLFSTTSKRLEREYQLFMLKAGVYSSPGSSITTDSDADNKNKSKLFVENIENILSAHHSESRFGGIFDTTFNQMPIS